MQQQGPPPTPYAYPPAYRDPHDYYVAGQDDKPGYLHTPERANPRAVTAFSFGASGLGLFVLSGGISFLVSIPCAVVAIVVGRRAMRAVDSGEATEHRRYAKGGFVMGIVTCALASFTAVSFILAAVFPDQFDAGGGEPGALPLMRAAEMLVRYVTGI